MKLHISVGQQALAGYINIDVNEYPIDLAKLDNICDTSECTDIIINDLLKFVSYEQLPLVIQHLYSRLRHHGKITFIFTDLNSIIKEFNTGMIDEKMLNILMFTQGSRCCFSYDHVVRMLKAININILSIEITKEQVVIIAERS